MALPATQEQPPPPPPQLQPQEEEEFENENEKEKEKEKEKEEDIDNHYLGTPIKFLPLRHVYSATSPCAGSSNVVSKKVRARRVDEDEEEREEGKGEKEEEKYPNTAEVTHVYSRKRKRGRGRERGGESFYEALVRKFEGGGEKGLVVVKEEVVEEAEEDNVGCEGKRRRVGSSELVKLGVDSSVLCRISGQPRLRESSRFPYSVSGGSKGKVVGKKRNSGCSSGGKPENLRVKKWFQLSYDGVDPMVLVGLKCKVYWPLDDDWYKASVVGHDKESGQHNVKYEDGDEEALTFSKEQIQFHISREEMLKLNLKGKIWAEDDDPDYSVLFGLAATVDESRELEPGDIIWAKLAGHAMWPAVIVDESLVTDRMGLSKGSAGRSVPVQFFGSHDFARIQVKQIVPFLKGLISCFHLKCKTPRFLRSLKEAKVYLNEQKLPKDMLNTRSVCEDDQDVDSDDQDDDNFWLWEDLSNARLSSKSSDDRYRHIGGGYRGVRLTWKDLDRCNVCFMDDEYENNLFLQCDKCRMMVHARCYGEESVDGEIWLCNLCRVGAPEIPPPCRLCPIVGGAMKPTTDGHWAHLACAIWIPETCLSDIKRMEPIDGLSRIKKDRWKLSCSICHVPYGACIQCSNSTCYVAYHPLCARASGNCVELENEDRLHLISFDEDEEEQCIRLLSFCKKHKQPANGRQEGDETEEPLCSSYIPPINESGCARCEPYDYSGRRGRKEPEVLAAASVKRLFVENRPYLVGGLGLHDPFRKASQAVVGSKYFLRIQNSSSTQESSQNILSMADKYRYMRETFRKRLAFGKSRIHGFGIFAKHPHKPGDMVIEYTGEIVRPSVADRREHMIYNSLVGAGTYMFRIDDERVVDATKAGSIAHLINHSCEPNCYSRSINVCGDEHIIIFAKRDIMQWEELTYDYRFCSIDEQLKCSCGVSNCRGVVNDVDAQEHGSKLSVPRSELIEWNG